ncbi:V-set and transmembrane domain-containing protein 4a isoform X3 [Thalassophryne amazonica]|uniref:V-set and transmembrane domain-containing protein 4a isoform X3 n=1 Tax=Thalassophryne amazonica TaxID=390379 RepID=UPI0014726AF4|nr:V-set and transmembrane domain-containing protein 4a isoform X3 [Thalassophryne amazonica]
MYFSVVVLILTKALLTAVVCHGLNVTVTPGPVVMVTERDNLTLSCLVSQRKRSGSLLILRWFFSPPSAPSPSPPPSSLSLSPPVPVPSQFLIVKMGIKKMKLYGNYTRRFLKPKFQLYEETEGKMYQLLIVHVTRTDCGFYTCRVQEIHKHRNTWRASSNGSSTTMLTESYLLVKCPESSSGETVTSSSSYSSSSPKAQKKERIKKTDINVIVMSPKIPEKPPRQLPTKVPDVTKRPQKPRRLKTHSRRPANPRVQDDSLTYAELELFRPRPEPSATSNPDPAPPASSTDTVYAQILFQEKQL